MRQIKRISSSKWTKGYDVEPIFFKSLLEKKSIKYLRNQKYLDFRKIYQILKINFNKKYPIGFVLKSQKLLCFP